MNKLSSKNMPAFVADAASSNEPIDVRTLNVRGTELSFRRFEGGYTSVNSVFGVAHKATLATYGQIRGFIGALSTLLDNQVGTFVEGFHCTTELTSISNIWDAAKSPVAYVNWSLLKDENIIAFLAAQGLKAEDEGGRWVALGAKRGNLYRWFVNVPQTWEEFTTWLLAEKGFGPKDDAAKMFIEDWYEKAWNIQNRHDGFEIALRLLAGKLFVGMKYAPANDAEIRKAARLETEFNMLFSGVDARREHVATKKANGDTADQLRKTVYAIAHSENPSLGEYAQAAADTGMVTVYRDGGLAQAKRSEIIGQNVKFVYRDGSRVNGASPRISNDALLTAALQMAQSFNALISLA